MLRIINTIPDYDSLTEFSCMTEWETKRVMAQFRKKYNIPEEDVHMGDGAEAESGQGLPTQPEEEQADEPQADDADAARESERSGKQHLLQFLRKSVFAFIAVVLNTAMMSVKTLRRQTSRAY